MTVWPLLWVALAAAVMMLGGWAWQRRSDNAGIVDVLWSAGMAASAAYYAAVLPGATLPRLLVALLGGLWGARLALHLARRVFSEEEDGRYRNLRKRWNGSQRNFLLFFLAQAGFVVCFSFPFWIAAHNPIGKWTAWTVLAIVTWLVSVAGESIAEFVHHNQQQNKPRIIAAKEIFKWGNHRLFKAFGHRDNIAGFRRHQRRDNTRHHQCGHQPVHTLPAEPFIGQPQC